MIRLNLLFLIILLFSIPSLTLADNGGFECTPSIEAAKEDPTTYTHKKVDCKITVAMYVNRGCIREYANNFTIKMTGAVDKTVTCKWKNKNQFAIFFSSGNNYTCNSGTARREYSWNKYGTNSLTCQNLVDWVLSNP